tara:strand:+ start:828 stop:1055 length:228 start_codon:yes stop_codon:yes gene_type:complete
MPYKPEFLFGPTERQTNAQVFETKEEALGSASDRFQRWTMPTGFDAVFSEDPVNYFWNANDGDARLPLEPAHVPA